MLNFTDKISNLKVTQLLTNVGNRRLLRMIDSKKKNNILALLTKKKK